MESNFIINLKSFDSCTISDAMDKIGLFGARTLAGLSMDLSRSEKHQEAISIAEFATETEPKKIFGFYAILFKVQVTKRRP